MKTRTKYSAKFKSQVVLELLREELTLNELSKKHNISPVVISRWKKEFLERADTVFEKGPTVAEKELEKKTEYIETLEKKVGKQTCEIDFLKKKSEEALGPGWEERARRTKGK